MPDVNPKTMPEDQITITLSRVEWESILQDMQFASVTGDCTDDEERRSNQRMELILEKLHDRK